MKKNFKGNKGYQKSARKTHKIEYNFHDWCVARELKALDNAWECEVQDIYGWFLDAHRYTVDSGDETKHEEYLAGVESTLIKALKAVTEVYKEKREEVKAKFSGNMGESDERIDGLKRMVNEKYGIICDDLVDEAREGFKFHKYTPEKLEEMGIIKGTLAKGRLHPDDVGKELTPEMLNRVIWESAEEDE